MGQFKYYFFFFILFSQSFVNSQIKIKELPPYLLSEVDSSFFGLSPTRYIVHLNENWYVYTDIETAQKVKVTVPSIFSGENSLFYENVFNLTSEQITDYEIDLNFLGLNYSAEIVLNELLIFKHPGGEFPFLLKLDPNNLLIGENKLVVKVFYQRDSEATIPLKQSFMFPNTTGGITRDVYLHFSPNSGITSTNFEYKFNSTKSLVNVEFNVEVRMSDELLELKDEEEKSIEKNLLFEFWAEGDTSSIYSSDRPLRFRDNTESETYKFRIRDFQNWTIESPHKYTAKIKLLHGEKVIDEIEQKLPIYETEEPNGKKTFTKNELNFKGTTYIYSDELFINLVEYKRLKTDLEFIKKSGFNFIRFSKELPHPYALELCEKLGLYALIEIPLNSLPEAIAEETSMTKRAENYLKYIINSYKNYNAVAAIGVGSSYLPDSEIHKSFISNLSEIVKNNSDKFTFASFVGFPQDTIKGLDFYGVELYLNNIEDLEAKFEESAISIGKENLFISEATYPAYNGASNGYLNENTFEAQAKYFDELIKFITEKNYKGFFINTFADYNGNFPSFYSGYSENSFYMIGLTGTDRGTNRLSYKSVSSRIKNADKVTIPIGTTSNDSPILFILAGLGLSLFSGLLINSNKKFRQDASRALLRPYNFFADIRDHRILSGFHASVLMFVLAGAHSLLITNLLYFWRTNILFEKLLISFGEIWIIKLIGHLAWNPYEAIIYLFIISLTALILVTVIIKISSLFITTKVYYSNVFFVVVWSSLPLALLLPLEMVLYRVLEANNANLYIYIFLLLYALWVLQRVMKGIYVIFDVTPAKVYMYSFLIIVFTIGGILLYFHISESSFYYIINAIKQYHFMY
jgi:beta-galactosidase